MNFPCCPFLFGKWYNYSDWFGRATVWKCCLRHTKVPWLINKSLLSQGLFLAPSWNNVSTSLQRFPHIAGLPKTRDKRRGSGASDISEGQLGSHAGQETCPIKTLSLQRGLMSLPTQTAPCLKCRQAGWRCISLLLQPPQEKILKTWRDRPQFLIPFLFC